MLISRQSAIRELFDRMNAESPFVQPPLAEGEVVPAESYTSATVASADQLQRLEIIGMDTIWRVWLPSISRQIFVILPVQTVIS